MNTEILQINTAYGRGGAAAVARLLHLAINGPGTGCHSTYAFARGPRPGDDASTRRFGGGIDTLVHGSLTRLSGIEGRGTARPTRRLNDLIDRGRFDIVHLHNLHGYYLDFPVLLRRLGTAGTPLVWTLHDCWPMTGKCPFFGDCRAWQDGCGDCRHLDGYPKSFFDSTRTMWNRKKDLFSSLPNLTLVTPSRWLAGVVRDSFLGDREVRVINNAVDTEVFRPLGAPKSDLRRELGLPTEGKVILFMAADLNEDRKGAGYFSELSEDLDPKKYHLVAAGEKLRLKAGKGRNIRQLGFIRDRGALVRLYNAADVLCVTSLDDNFPTTVLEAMACGTPTVAFAVGGIPEQLEGGCGLTVPTKRTDLLKEALESLLDDEDGLLGSRANCRKKAVADHSIPVFLKSYLALYKDVLNGSGRRSGQALTKT